MFGATRQSSNDLLADKRRRASSSASAPVRIPGSPILESRGGEGGIRALEAGFSHLRDFQSRSFGQLGHLSPVHGFFLCCQQRLRFESPDLRSSKIVAEREGFEPSVRFNPYNRLAGGCLQPTRPPLRLCRHSKVLCSPSPIPGSKGLQVVRLRSSRHQ